MVSMTATPLVNLAALIVDAKCFALIGSIAGRTGSAARAAAAPLTTTPADAAKPCSALWSPPWSPDHVTTPKPDKSVVGLWRRRLSRG
jgi:hypothetical protein